MTILSHYSVIIVTILSQKESTLNRFLSKEAALERNRAIFQPRTCSCFSHMLDEVALERNWHYFCVFGKGYHKCPLTYISDKHEICNIARVENLMSCFKWKKLYGWGFCCLPQSCLAIPESRVEIRHRSLQSFIAISNFSVVAKGLDFEALRRFTAQGFLVVPEFCVEIRHAIFAKFHKPFFRRTVTHRCSLFLLRPSKTLWVQVVVFKVQCGSARNDCEWRTQSLRSKERVWQSHFSFPAIVSLKQSICKEVASYIYVWNRFLGAQFGKMLKMFDKLHLSATNLVQMQELHVFHR